MGRGVLRAVILSASLVLVAGCGGSAEEATGGLPDDATVTYAFTDSSVPPQYHRSVALTVTRDEAHIVIDSYGDVLADERVPTPASVWGTLGSTLPAVESLTVADPGEGCTGGTGISLTVETPEGPLLDLAPQFCAGSNEDLEAPIDGWIAPARSLFPATEVLAPEGE
jgi:hypothetical protein